MAESNNKGNAGPASARAPEIVSAAGSRVSYADVAAYLDDLAIRQATDYTADEDAVWSEVLARNAEVVAQHADRIHPDYIEGLRALALPSRVPRAEELNRRLAETGWRVVAVDGYIPATMYAALMAEQVFPVSSRIRRREHIDYAPEPDMVHDILGHLPMLFCAEHRDYLRALARHASRATANQLDSAYYDAVRRSAELKCRPERDPEAEAHADAALEEVYRALMVDASETACLRRMYIWSIEFGLFGSGDDYMIHGAALMSAPTELRRVLSGSPRLEPYSLHTIQHENSFSQLLERYFVARDYRHLHEVLAAYAGSMHQSMLPAASDVHELRPAAREVTRRSNA